MEEQKQYVELQNLEVYRLAREYSRQAWSIYKRMDWQMKKVQGDQMIASVDSVGANIAEGYGRFHYLDKNKFYYNARGSLLESYHWIELLYERKKIALEIHTKFKDIYQKILLLINVLIRSQYQRKQQ